MVFQEKTSSPIDKNSQIFQTEKLILPYLKSIKYPQFPQRSAGSGFLPEPLRTEPFIQNTWLQLISLELTLFSWA